MRYRVLGKTGAEISTLSLGGAPFGQEYTNKETSDVARCVAEALELGINLIDTAPFYGRGMSEVLLGLALQDLPRQKYYLSTKLGRYDLNHFDFSAKRVEESIDVSLHRLRTDYLDIVYCHDIEFVNLNQIVEETIPALQKQQEAGKVRWIGISGYPLKIFTEVLGQCDLDTILSYRHYSLINTTLSELVPLCKEKEVGIVNASVFEARLLTNAPLPPWHQATEEVREAAQKAAKLCTDNGSDIAKLALQFALQNEDMTSCLAGSEKVEFIRQWAAWSEEEIDRSLLEEVQKILQPVHNFSYIEGLPENN